MILTRIIILALATAFTIGCGNKSKETGNAVAPAEETAINVPGEDSGKTNDTGLPVIIDFSATWCGPCKMISPYVHELAESNKEVVTFKFIDVDENTSMAEEYRVEAVPTFILLDADGREVSRVVGADEAGLANLVSKARSLER